MTQRELVGEVVYTLGGVGSNYCGPAVPNSAGSAGAILGTGSAVLANNDFGVTASSLPPNAFGLFLTSTTQGFIVNPGNSQGNLCLGGSIGR